MAVDRRGHPSDEGLRGGRGKCGMASQQGEKPRGGNRVESDTGRQGSALTLGDILESLVGRHIRCMKRKI